MGLRKHKDPLQRIAPNDRNGYSLFGRLRGGKGRGFFCRQVVAYDFRANGPIPVTGGTVAMFEKASFAFRTGESSLARTPFAFEVFHNIKHVFFRHQSIPGATAAADDPPASA